MDSQPAYEAQPLRCVVWLGYGGLVPFVALAVASVIASYRGQNPQFWSQALIAYGAAILSFVGALHWGFAMALRGLTPAQRTTCFVWSVVPALVAWVALLAPPMPAVALLVAGFGAHYRRDRSLAKRSELPDWYLPMRLRLTLVACLCLLMLMLALAPPLLLAL